MPTIQNFSVPAGDSKVLKWKIDPDDDMVALDPGTQIIWRVYEQANGIPAFDTDAVLSKDLDNGIEITDPDARLFEVTLTRDDTLTLLRNYYHEARVVDPNGNYSTVALGIMTVTGTEIR